MDGNPTLYYDKRHAVPRKRGCCLPKVFSNDKFELIMKIVFSISDAYSMQPGFYQVGSRMCNIPIGLPVKGEYYNPIIDKIILTERNCQGPQEEYKRPCYIGYDDERNELFQCWADTMNVMYRTINKSVNN